MTSISKYTVYELDQMDDVFKDLRKRLILAPQDVTIETHTRQRTLSQNNAMHQYLKNMATEIDAAGITQRILLNKFKNGWDVPVTMHFLKGIFRQLANDMFGVESTADLTTTQMQEVYEAFNQAMGFYCDVSMDWPSRKPPPYGSKK